MPSLDASAAGVASSGVPNLSLRPTEASATGAAFDAVFREGVIVLAFATEAGATGQAYNIGTTIKLNAGVAVGSSTSIVQSARVATGAGTGVATIVVYGLTTYFTDDDAVALRPGSRVTINRTLESNEGDRVTLVNATTPRVTISGVGSGEDRVTIDGV